MRPRIRTTLVALTATVGLIVTGAASATAARPAPAASCSSGDTTVTVKFDRAGNPQNTSLDVTVDGTSSGGTITADSSVLITSYVRKAGRTSDFVPLADPVSETTYDNAGLFNKRGKSLTLTELDVCTTPNTTPPAPETAGITFGPDPEIAGYTLILYVMPSSPDRELTYYLSGYNQPADDFTLNEYVAPMGTGVGYQALHAAPGNHVTGALYVDTTSNLIESFDCTVGVDCPTS